MQPLVSSAQNFEDIMLWRALAKIEQGSYVDIGAQDPSLDSVSKLFYDQGWRGINVEPTPHYADLLRRWRPDEVVVQAAVGAKSGVLNFYEFPDTGLSTANRTIAEQHIKRGYQAKEIVVPCVTLDKIFGGLSGKDIHWLKIDVEGGEKEVLKGWVHSHLRPWIVVIESTYPMSQVETHKQWEMLILAKGYQFAYFDGLSRFYVAKGHDNLLEAFSAGPNVFDVMFHGFSLGATTPFCGNLHSQILSLKEQGEHIRQDAEQQLATSKQEYASQLLETERRNSERLVRLENDHRLQIENLMLEGADRERTLKADLAMREKAQGELIETVRSELNSLQRSSLQREQEFVAQLLTIQRQTEQRAARLEQSFSEQNDALRRTHTKREDELSEQLSLAKSDLHRVERELDELSKQLSLAKSELHRVERESARDLVHVQDQAMRQLAAKERRHQTVLDTILRKQHASERLLADEVLKLQAELNLLKLDYAHRDNAHIDLANRLRKDLEDSQRTSVEREQEFTVQALEVQQKFDRQIRSQTDTHRAREKSLQMALAEVEQELELIRRSVAWRMMLPFRTLISLLGNSRLQEPRKCNSEAKSVSELYLIVDHNAISQRVDTATPNKIHSQILQMEPSMPLSSRSVAKPEPSVEGLLEQHDVAFVEAAYLSLLGRTPDPDGFDHYLGRLRAGDSKVKLIAEIAESREARQRNNQLVGLRELVTAHRRASHWFWGLFFRRQNIEQQVRLVENQMGRMIAEMTEWAAELNARAKLVEEPIRKNHAALEAELARISKETSKLAADMNARIIGIEQPIADLRQLLEAELGRISADVAKISAPKVQPLNPNTREYEEAIKPITVSVHRSTVPKFSIIILQFNKSELTINCVRSVLRYSDLEVVEVIVVDNGSAPEHTANIRNEFENQIVVVDVGTNRYFGEGNNIGVDHASGEFIVFMNNDVVVTANWLERLQFHLKGDVEVVGPAFCFPDGRVQECGGYIKEDGNSIQQFRGDNKKQLPQAPFECDYISAATILLRKETFLKVGGFDLCYEPAYYEDVDLCLKIASYGGRVICDPSIVIFHNENATSSDSSLGLRLTNDVVETNKTKFVDRWRTFLADRINHPAENQKILGTAKSPVRFDAPKQPKTAKRAILFSPYPMTPGGGEKYLLTIAQELSKTYLTTLAFEHRYSTSRLRQLERYLNLDLSGVSLMDFSLAKLQSWDVAFVLGNSVAPPFQKLSPTSFYICQFPFDRQYFLSRPLPFADAYHYLCYSEFVKDHILEGKGMQSSQVTVLAPVIQAYPRASVKERIIVSVGRFFAGGHCKNQQLLIEAFKRLVSGGLLKGWKLVLVGSTRPEYEHRMYYRQCREAAEGLNVEIVPDASFETLSDLYGRAALYWHGAGLGIDPGESPEKLEHFGITPLEAASAGCHVFVPAVGGPLEIAERAPGNFHLFETIDELVELTDVLCGKLVFENDPCKPEMDRFIASFNLDTFGKHLDKTISRVSQNNTCDATTLINANDHRVRWAGWSEVEGELRWSSGHESRIEFLWGEVPEKSCWVTIRFHTLGAQKIHVELNGVALWDAKVSGQNQEVTLEVRGLTTGFNCLAFSFPNAHQPGSSDGRLLAMRLASLSFSAESTSQATMKAKNFQTGPQNQKNTETTKGVSEGLAQ